MTRISGLWTAIARRLALTLLRSVGINPYELRKSMEGLDHRVATLEQGNTFSDLELAILRLLYGAGCYPGSTQSNQSDTRLSKGLRESELIEALRLDYIQSQMLQKAALKLVVLGIIEHYQYYYMTPREWSLTNHGLFIYKNIVWDVNIARGR